MHTNKTNERVKPSTSTNEMDGYARVDDNGDTQSVKSGYSISSKDKIIRHQSEQMKEMVDILHARENEEKELNEQIKLHKSKLSQYETHIGSLKSSYSTMILVIILLIIVFLVYMFI